MHINMQWVWAAIIAYAVLSLAAMVFVHGSCLNKLEGE
jgi:hypothetical protein